ncbi:response regulator [Gracilinema caldarium]|uniref:ATP-binding response regulator n=1 Tax=Gracilinema caldarium TaxID=215591 RepID=UPI0026E95B2C|nr:response regulator [Gracilinema caldarium]
MAKIIICEDENIVALDIKRHLERFGYEVAGIYDCAENAISACARDKPNLVLMDIQLSGAMDGLDASTIIYQNHNIPVIMLTAYADDITLARVKDGLPFGYILKPFEDRELKTAIEIALFRHEMDEKLRKSEARYRTLFEDAPTANFTADGNGILTDCNTTFIKLLDIKNKEDVIGQSIFSYFADTDNGNRLWQSFLNRTNGVSQDWELKRSDGTRVFVLATLSILPRTEDKPLEIQGYLLDNTEHRDLENQLRQAQKMEAIGRLAGGIAHDFNNIITAIMGYGNLLREDIEDNPLLKEEVEGILSATQRAVNLTRQLLSFSRKQAVEAKVVNIHDILKDLEKMIQRLVNENIQVTLALNASTPFVSIDPGQFEQTIVNLVVNARDAIKGNGSIIIQTKSVICDNTCHQHGIKQGKWLQIIVKDNGCGISAEDMQHIFEPFFTTKEKDKGTGLGLSTVYAIISRSGGQIAVESTVGAGTTFFIYLPEVEEKSESISNTAQKVEPKTRSGTIIVAEDDEFIRGLISRLLAKSGYRVLESTDPHDAIRIAEHEKDYMLLTDIVMPQMNGYDLATRLSEKSPGLKVLFISGYQDRSFIVPEKNLENIKSLFLEKPFSHEVLLETIDKLAVL